MTSRARSAPKTKRKEERVTFKQGRWVFCDGFICRLRTQKCIKITNP
jgi:hypothetical protein